MLIDDLSNESNNIRMGFLPMDKIKMHYCKQNSWMLFHKTILKYV